MKFYRIDLSIDKPLNVMPAIRNAVACAIDITGGQAMTTKRPGVAFLMLCLVIALPLQAGEVDGDLERESLSRLAAEIEQLRPLIDDAQKVAMTDQRVRFRYDVLRRDLEQIRAGIVEHVKAPRVVPRSIEPLSGDYRQ